MGFPVKLTAQADYVLAKRDIAAQDVAVVIVAGGIGQMAVEFIVRHQALSRRQGREIGRFMPRSQSAIFQKGDSRCLRATPPLAA